MATTWPNVKKGTTDKSIEVFFFDDTTGAPETGLTSATSGISIKYHRPGAASETAISLSDLTALDDAHSDGGMLEKSNGRYRLDLPDAALASGVDEVVITGAATGMYMETIIIPLVDYDPNDSVRLGLTALPNAAADAAGGLPISDAGGLDLDTQLAATNEITAARMGALTDWIDGGRLDLIIDAIVEDTNELQTDDIPGLIGSPSDFGSGTSTLAANLQDLADNGTATFDRSTDSLQAIRDRGDAAWTTGAGGNPFSLASGTIGATGNDTTHLHLDGLGYGDDELNGCLIVVFDDSASLYYSTWITDWANTGDLATVETLPFTPEASTDTYVVLGVRKDGDVASILADTAVIGTPADTDIATDIANLVTTVGTPADTDIATDLANIQTEVDKLDDAQAEPTGVPAANESPLAKIGRIYMMARNKKTVTATKKTYYGDDDAAEFEADLSDDDTTYTESELNSV